MGVRTRGTGISCDTKAANSVLGRSGGGEASEEREVMKAMRRDVKCGEAVCGWKEELGLWAAGVLERLGGGGRAGGGDDVAGVGVQTQRHRKCHRPPLPEPATLLPRIWTTELTTPLLRMLARPLLLAHNSCGIPSSRHRDPSRRDTVIRGLAGTSRAGRNRFVTKWVLRARTGRRIGLIGMTRRDGPSAPRISRLPSDRGRADFRDGGGG